MLQALVVIDLTVMVIVVGVMGFVVGCSRNAQEVAGGRHEYALKAFRSTAGIGVCGVLRAVAGVCPLMCVYLPLPPRLLLFFMRRRCRRVVHDVHVGQTRLCKFVAEFFCARRPLVHERQPRVDVRRRQMP